jgi:hypothetical protein
VVNKEEEVLGVPPLGSGYTLQFLVGCASCGISAAIPHAAARSSVADRPLRPPPSKHAALKTPSHPDSPKYADRKTTSHPNFPKHAALETRPHPNFPKHAVMTNRSPSDFDKNSSIIMIVGFISRKKLSRKLESILRPVSDSFYFMNSRLSPQ